MNSDDRDKQIQEQRDRELAEQVATDDRERVEKESEEPATKRVRSVFGDRQISEMPAQQRI